MRFNMSFRVGDKVRVVARTHGHDFKIGHIGVVTSVDEINKQYDIDDKWWLVDEELEFYCGDDPKHSSDGGSTEYYQLPPDAKELFDLINYRNMNFAIGNIFKACYRLNQKQGNDAAYDLRKIIFMAEQELKRIGED